MSYSPREIEDLLRYMSPEDREFITKLYAQDVHVWRPLPGPQTLAAVSEADVIGFGGAAGGGKTDLALGLALTEHRVVQFFRKHATELTPVYDRLHELLGPGKYRDMHGVWRIPRAWAPLSITFGSLANPGDERKWQGNPKDLLAVDEAANMLGDQVRFIMAWLRSVVPGQRKRVLLTFNPPTTSEGRWVVGFFAPWLDDRHINPAGPGELRWFIGTKDTPDFEVADARPRVEVGGRLLTEFNPREFRPESILLPKSRTFIPSRISDNPYLAGTGYMATLQALPEPLRSQMLYGDFKAGMIDSEWQVIPTKWVDDACARWTKRTTVAPMTSEGVDVARGGADNTIIMRLHEDNWFNEPLVYPATQTPDGPTVAGLSIAANRDLAPIHIDVDGVGSSPYDFLNKAGFQVIGVKNAEAAPGTDKSGLLTFANIRSWGWWMLREALDPHSNLGLALPPDARLIQDLTTPRFELRGKQIYVEGRDDLLKPTRLGRSPDWGTATWLAWIRTPKIAQVRARHAQMPAIHAHDPYAALSGNMTSSLGHDPYA